MREQVGDLIRSLPGGRRVLRGRRELRKRVRARLRPTLPVHGSPAQVAARSRAPEDESFITGNGLAARCRYVLNYGPLVVNEDRDNDWWFVNGDSLEYFFRNHAPDRFVLLSHNSDREIGRRFLRELRRPRLVAWFAQNPVLEHPKLRALPVGVANPYWPHGDQAALRAAQAASAEKSRLFDVSFNVETNPSVRRYCLEQTGLELAPQRPFPEYLEGLARSWFCVSPRGNGIDCMRTWEALYLKTIPVVTRSLVTEHHADLPLVVLDDWSEFRSIDFSPELYRRLWGDWDPAELRLDRYCRRIEERVAELRR